MTTNNLVVALQDTLSRYQQNGTQKNDITQQLEAQINDLKVMVAHLQASLRAAQDEKRMLLETLSEQSQQLSQFAHLLAPAAMALNDAVVDEPLSVVTPETESVSFVEEEEAPITVKTRSRKKSQDEAKAVPEVEEPARRTRAKKEKSEPVRLDKLWEMVRDYNKGKTNPERVKFDENLAVKDFGIAPEEWDAWYQGSNRAKVKRQPAQVRSNKRQAAKDAIALLKEDWVKDFPDSLVTLEVAPSTVSSGVQSKTTLDVGIKPSTERMSTKPEALLSAEAIAPPAKGELVAENLHALLLLFQSWNQGESNPSVRLTPYTATAFGVDVQQAREWMETHQEEIDQLNEGVPPNNRREARQALNRLKETWALVQA